MPLPPAAQRLAWAPRIAALAATVLVAQALDAVCRVRSAPLATPSVLARPLSLGVLLALACGAMLPTLAAAQIPCGSRKSLQMPSAESIDHT